MVKFYNAADQKLYEQYKFLPQEQYRLGLNLPTSDPTNDPVVDEGIVNTNAFNNSGNDFSVYNPDPNTISNSNYNEDPYKSYLYKDRFPMMGDPVANQATGALNADGTMSYPGDKPQSKFQEMLSQGINFSPLGIAKKGLDYLGNMLPVNRRAIMENQLSGQGIMVNDIGQIVSDGGNINTAENIMAGYNASKIDADTFQKRRTMIEDNLKAGKYKDPKKMQEKLNAINAAEERILGTATTQTNKIFDFEEEEKKKKKKDNIISRFFKKKKAADAKTTTGGTTGTTGTTTGGTTGTTTGGGTTAGSSGPAGGASSGGNYSGGPTYSGMGSIGSGGNGGNGGNSNTGGGASYSNTATTGAKDGYSYGLKKGGRAGYFFGGRVNYKTGGRINFRGGGADMGATDRAQERADRGYGSTAPADDRSSRQQTDNNNRVTGRGGNDTTKVFNGPKNKTNVVYENTLLGNLPTGLTKNLNYGRLTAILDLQKALRKEELDGKMQFDSSIGPVNTSMSYDTITGPEFNASYSNNNLNANYNTKTGLNANYIKDIGPGTFTAGGTYNPDGTYNAEAKYGISFAQGGRAGYAEGGPIYSRLGTLSSGVQSAEQQLQGINASLQKAESDLGSDSPGGGSSLAGGPSFTSNFEDANNQGPGSSLLFGGSMDQASPITAPTVPQEPGQPGGMFKDFDYSNGAIPPMNSIPDGPQQGRVPGNPELAGPVISSIGGGRIPGGNKGPESFGAVANPISSIGGVDPYKNTMISGLSQDGQRFDSAQNAFDALVEQTRKYREKSPYTRNVIGSERYRGEEGFKNFTNYFNEINDPSYSAPQLQSAGGGLGSFAPGVDPMGSRKENAAGPLQSLGRGIGSIL